MTRATASTVSGTTTGAPTCAWTPPSYSVRTRYRIMILSGFATSTREIGSSGRGNGAPPSTIATEMDSTTRTSTNPPSAPLTVWLRQSDAPAALIRSPSSPSTTSTRARQPPCTAPGPSASKRRLRCGLTRAPVRSVTRCSRDSHFCTRARPKHPMTPVLRTSTSLSGPTPISASSATTSPVSTLH